MVSTPSFSCRQTFMVPVTTSIPKAPRHSGADPKVCRSTREGRRPYVEAWGTGNASREFLYVEDCAEASCARRHDYNESEPVNIGTGSEIKISELLQLIARLTRFEGEIRWQTISPTASPAAGLTCRGRSKNSDSGRKCHSKKVCDALYEMV